MTPPRALQACLTCKRQKRKCDKALPSCSRCASLQRACDYSYDADSNGSSSAATAAAPTAGDFALLQLKLADIEARLDASAGSSHRRDAMGMDVDAGVWEGPVGYACISSLPTSTRFPSSLFLDIDMYHFAKKTPPKPLVDIPMEVLEILATSDVIEQTATTYFTTIHTWFSFISRKRMNLGISLAEGGPDLALLFLAMKLITTALPPDASSPDQTRLYAASKRFLALLEAAGTMSILYLQAMILIALYEYGHAIYPAAWMSIGNCVRYAAMLGLPSYAEASSVLGPCTTWTEIEERRRVWWAVHILDHAISLGSKRPFAGGPDLPSPTEVFLPVDDLAWDAGEMGRTLQRSLTTPVDSTISLSPFARLAQASLLVTKAMAHCRRAAGRYNEHHDRKRHRRRRRRRLRSKASSDTHRNASPRNRNGDDTSRHSASSTSTTPTSATKPYDVKEVTALLSEQSALCTAITRDLAALSSSSHQSRGCPTSSSAAYTPSTSTATTDLYLAYLPARCLVWSTSVMVLDMYACPEHMRPSNIGGTPSSFFSSRQTSTTASSDDDDHQEDIGFDDNNTEEMELAMQAEAINGLKTAGSRVREVSTELLSSFSLSASSSFSCPFPGEPNLDSGLLGPPPVLLLTKVSPLCLDVLYCGVSTFQWLWRESGDPDAKAGLDVTRACMEKLDTRWKLSGKYLEIATTYNEPVPGVGG